MGLALLTHAHIDEDPGLYGGRTSRILGDRGRDAVAVAGLFVSAVHFEEGNEVRRGRGVVLARRGASCSVIQAARHRSTTNHPGLLGQLVCR